MLQVKKRSSSKERVLVYLKHFGREKKGKRKFKEGSIIKIKILRKGVSRKLLKGEGISQIEYLGKGFMKKLLKSESIIQIKTLGEGVHEKTP